MTARSPKQLAAWREIQGVVDRHAQSEPEGWWDWLIGMRNAEIHRARNLTIQLQDGPTPKVASLVLPRRRDVRDSIVGMIPFALHLRKKPGAQDLQAMSEVKLMKELWIDEPAQRTLECVFECIGALVTDLSGTIHAQWRAIGRDDGAFPAPIEKWQLAPSGPAFQGFARQPSGVDHNGVMTNPLDLVRMKIALTLGKKERN